MLFFAQKLKQSGGSENKARATLRCQKRRRVLSVSLCRAPFVLQPAKKRKLFFFDLLLAGRKANSTGASDLSAFCPPRK